MGELFYRLVTFLYVVAVFIAKFFNEKAAKMWRGRRNQWKIISHRMEVISDPILWFHCSSLGEFEQGRPVIEKYKEVYPHVNIILTFFSPSGYEVRKNYDLAEAVFYLPFDRRKNAKKFIDLVNPSAAFFIKYEYWHFYLDELHLRNIPTFSISSIFRPNQLFFKPQGEFYRDILRKFTYFFVQNKLSKELLKDIELNNAMVVGDTRFDRVYQICQAAKHIEIAEKFKGSGTVMVVGSSWPNDIEKIAPFINQWIEEVKFIIAPHELEEKNFLQIEECVKGKVIRYSKAEGQKLADANVLLIDNIGMLSSLYRYGEYAYIGGAFDHGIHNTLEAATFGLPLFFGKSESNEKYQETVELLKVKAGFDLKDWKALDKQFTALFKDPSAYARASEAAKKYVLENTGATDKIFEHTHKLIQLT